MKIFDAGKFNMEREPQADHDQKGLINISQLVSQLLNYF